MTTIRTTATYVIDGSDSFLSIPPSTIPGKVFLNDLIFAEGLKNISKTTGDSLWINNIPQVIPPGKYLKSELIEVFNEFNPDIQISRGRMFNNNKNKSYTINFDKLNRIFGKDIVTLKPNTSTPIKIDEYGGAVCNVVNIGGEEIHYPLNFYSISKHLSFDNPTVVFNTIPKQVSIYSMIYMNNGVIKVPIYFDKPTTVSATFQILSPHK